MATRYFGKRIKRNEDARLLTGQALFVDDVNLPGMLYAAYYRSPYAHARIVDIDVSRAKEREGVVAVYTAEDLGDYWRTGVLNVSPPPIEGLIFNPRLHYNLAKDKVRHVWESVVCVVAESRYIAEDAVNDVVVNFDPLPVNIDPMGKITLPDTDGPGPQLFHRLDDQPPQVLIGHQSHQHSKEQKPPTHQEKSSAAGGQCLGAG